MTRERGRTFGIVGVGLVATIAASSAGMPPAAVPQQVPAVPAGTTVAVAAFPAAPPGVSPAVPVAPAFSPLPPIPAPPTVVAPVPAARPVPAKRPVEPDITEPVVTVHRFEGRYLGGDKTRALVYARTGPDAAEIQSRPFVRAIPAADADAKDDVRRIAVPAGDAVWHNGRTFLTTKRELLVIDNECRIDWKFALPGKPDNGESLLGIAGFYEGKLVLVTQHKTRSGEPDRATGHILTFDAATGRQVGFAAVADGFDASAKLSLDARRGTLVAVTGTRSWVYALATGATRWTGPLPAQSADPTVSDGAVFVTMPGGVGMPGRGSGGFELLARGAAGTAPARFVADENASDRAYLPIVSDKEQFALAVYEVRTNRSSVEWWVRTPKRITTRPVVHGQSVYFAAGNVVYRANVANGAVCWKQTVPLNPGEALTDLAVTEGELRGSGPGVLVRIADRAEPTAKP